ncbi:alpha-ribazole phosphatase [Solitalea sp. MAHUQ-68]|uniref:Alpha-ribazole phosphatase n=1 Tax=Solitalea agri TaxID=2953739 RepID=A0A9X2JDN6_9SPHI|nr:alpha-ribazole phosphatase [Solitalea agri]MCO4293829.1 alpha-ribazole phosphatase [Solitalea agri]
MDIYLIRHSEVETDKGICYGQSDVDVNASLLSATIEHLADFLPKRKVVYSSPLKRCALLAESLADEVYFDDYLKEMDFGNWELKAWSDIDKDELDPWMEDFVNVQVSGGESFVQLHQRVTTFMEEMTNECERENVVIVTHAGVIRSILCEVLQIPLKNAFKLTIDYSSVSKLKYNKGYWSVEFCNHKF